MYFTNISQILKQIHPNDNVLDIGGWAQPFNRANYVIDINQYASRKKSKAIGSEREFFSKETWIVHDLSDKSGLPFIDKVFDFVICSHVLEDIRDPVFLCSEIIRIGKRGYIESPSRILESIMHLERHGYAGFYHHRWLIEINNNELLFRFKNHLIHSSNKYHFNRNYLNKMSQDQKICYLFWENKFNYKEIMSVDINEVATEMEQYVRKVKKNG
jgi:ubiquinone/menaquinone biosynthesis C-methylase UbiE